MSIYRPWVRVNIEGQSNRDVALDSTLKHIINVQTVKSIGSPEGTWSLVCRDTLDNGTLVSESVRPNDRVEIALGHGGPEGSEPEVVMVGLVDQVSGGEAVDGDGRIVLTATITGRDMTKVLTQFKLSNSYAINAQNAYEARILFEGLFSRSMNVSEMIFAIMEALNALDYPRIRFKSWKGRSALEDIEIDSSSTYNVLGSVLAGYSGPVWGLLKEVAGAPFHECWLDTWHGSSVLHVRPTPYSTLNKLKCTAIERADFTQREYGSTDKEVVNVAFMALRLFRDNFQIYNPVVDADSLSLFGLRDQTIKTNIVPANYNPPKPDDNITEAQAAAARESAAETVVELQKKYLSWFARADKLKAGYVAVRGDPKYRVGECVYFPDRGMRFYVEAVRHQADFGETPSFVTGLTLTRGESVQWRRA